MPFREKSAWISLVTVLGVFGAFYGALITGRVPSSGLLTLHYLLMSLAAVVILQVVLRVAAALLAREEAGTPKDERERLIELKAAQIAYAALALGVLGAVFLALHTRLFGNPPGVQQLGLGVLAALILADLVKSAATIAFYRRGA